MPKTEKDFRVLSSIPFLSGLQRLPILGGSIVAPPAMFFDDFQRADETPVATPWEAATWGTRHNLVSGHLAHQGGGNKVSVVDVAPYGLGLNVKVTADFTVNGGASPDSGVLLGNGENFLLFYNVHTTWGVYVLNTSADIVSTISSGSSAPGGPINKVFEITSNGTSYTYTINGSLLWSGTSALSRTSTKYGWFDSRDDPNTLNSFKVESYP